VNDPIRSLVTVNYYDNTYWVTRPRDHFAIESLMRLAAFQSNKSHTLSKIIQVMYRIALRQNISEVKFAL